ncbi:MAG: hypothetical protein WC506_04085 [Candidatus Micrarchaeia archaeon]
MEDLNNLAKQWGYNDFQKQITDFISQIRQNIAKTIYMNSLSFSQMKSQVSRIQSANIGQGRAAAVALGKTFSDYLKSQKEEGKLALSQEKSEAEIRKIEEAKAKFENLLKANMLLSGISPSSLPQETVAQAFAFAQELNSGSINVQPGSPSSGASAIKIPTLAPEEVRASVADALAAPLQNQPGIGAIRFRPVRTGAG